MNDRHVARIDLNLLKAFDALSETRSVTRAAARLHIGQPAMSHALARLRDVFDDPLFVRTANGMEPTVEALRLGETIGRVLDDLDGAFRSREPFDPAAQTHTFTIGLSDYIEAILLPDLMAELQKSAPGIDIILRQIGFDDFAGMIDDGTIDLAVGYLPTGKPWHRRRTLFTETRSCLYAPHRLGVKPPIGLEDYVRASHVVRALTGSPRTFVDEALATMGRERNVSLTTPRYTTLPDILTAAALIATVPTRLAQTFAAKSCLAVSALPFAAPEFDVSMIWHARNDADPSLIWLKARLDVLSNGGGTL